MVYKKLNKYVVLRIVAAGSAPRRLADAVTKIEGLLELLLGHFSDLTPSKALPFPLLWAHLCLIMTWDEESISKDMADYR
jgi:hypothetical protein